MSKNEKSKPQNTDTAKVSAKANKQSSTKSSANPKGDNPKSKKPETKPVNQAVDTTETVQPAAEQWTYRLVRGEAQVTGFDRNNAVLDLQGKYTLETIEKKFNKGDVIPSDTALYSTDKAKLEKLAADKGWTKTAESSETENASANEVATETVFALIKQSHEIIPISTVTAFADLGSEFSETQINKLFSSETAILETAGFFYSMNKSELEKIVEENGWTEELKVAETIHEDGTIESDTEPWVNEPETEPHYEYDDDAIVDAALEEYDSSVADAEPVNALPDGLSVNTDEKGNVLISGTPTEGGVYDFTVTTEPSGEVDLTDPNQKIYDELVKPEFFQLFNKKETDLILKLQIGKKSIASLSLTDASLWESIQEKYTKFQMSRADEILSGNSDQEPIENFRKPDALVKADAPIQGIIDPELDTPLAEHEKTELETLEKTVESAKDAFEKAPFAMASALAEIRKRKLYRGTHKTFEGYVADRFGITRQYAQNLAQGGDFRLVLAEISESSLQLAGSVNATNEWLRGTNEIAESMGIGKSEFDVMKPIIQSVAQMVADIATDESGNVTNAAPRIFSAVTDIISEVVKSNIVTIDGKQMTIETAKAEGVLGLAVKSEIVETVAEQILTQKQIIIDSYKEKEKRRTEPHEAVKPKAQNGKEQFVGEIPTHSASCSAHPDMKDNFVLSVFNAGFELACKCKFQLIEGQGDLFVCIESDGKAVKYD